MLQVQYVLFVPKLRYNVYSVPVIKQKGFAMIFQDGKVRLRTKGSNSVGVVIGVKDHGLYQQTSNPIDHEKKQV